MDSRETPEAFDPATSWADPPGMAKALTIGVAVGVAVSFLGVGGAFLAGGQGWGPSIGMGAFVAMWGGLGFGGMIGGVVWASRVEAAAERERAASQSAVSTGEAPEPVVVVATAPVEVFTSSQAPAEVPGVMPQPHEPDGLSGDRPAHPMRASIILVTAVALLIVLLAVTSSVS